VERHQRRAADSELGESRGAVPGGHHLHAKRLGERAQKLDDPLLVLAREQDRSRFHVAQASPELGGPTCPSGWSRCTPSTPAIVPFSRRRRARVNKPPQTISRLT